MKKKKEKKLKKVDYLSARKFSIKLAVEQYPEANTKEIFSFAEKVFDYIFTNEEEKYNGEMRLTSRSLFL